MNFLPFQAFISYLCFYGATFHGTGNAMPNVSQTDLELSILTDNDLFAEESSRTTSVILVESPQTWNNAYLTCNVISESVWAPTSQSFGAGLNNTLSYQVYLEKYSSSQKFWIKTSSGCKAIDPKGNIRDESCSKRLPVICTNSAPLSSWDVYNTTESYQISRKVGKQVVTGYRDRNSFRFLGVRYSLNPGRFEHSKVYEGKGEVTALEYKPQCMQNFMLAGVVSGEEDCFFLSIWTPYLPGKALNTKSLKPVIVWIHGGGLLHGNPNDQGTDGGYLASRGDIVQVSVSYRLGTLGWIAIDEKHRGNYGLSDFIMALKWIQVNIKDYGGDPDRVTLVGESGGAAGVRAVLASPKSKGLVHRAIPESGSWGWGPQKVHSEYYNYKSSITSQATQLAAEVGCSNSPDLMNCLRALDGSRIQGSPVLSNWPLIDDKYLFGDYGVTGDGYAADIPILIGTVRDEVANIIAGAGGYGPTDPREIVEIMGPSLLSKNVTYLLDDPAFPRPSGDLIKSAFNVSNKILSQHAITCLTWATAYSLDKHRVSSDVYVYSFNRTYSPKTWQVEICDPPRTSQFPNGDFDAEYYKCHAGELTLASGLIKFIGGIDRDGRDIPFSQLILDTWASFARTGNPNPDLSYLKARGYWNTIDRVRQAGKWPKLDWKNPKIKILQWNSHYTSFTEQSACKAMGLPVTYYEDL